MVSTLFLKVSGLAKKIIAFNPVFRHGILSLELSLLIVMGDDVGCECRCDFRREFYTINRKMRILKE